MLRGIHGLAFTLLSPIFSHDELLHIFNAYTTLFPTLQYHLQFYWTAGGCQKYHNLRLEEDKFVASGYNLYTQGSACTIFGELKLHLTLTVLNVISFQFLC